MTASICETYKRLADQTWERIEAAERVGMRWSEETNTETLLLQLRQRHPSQVLIAAFSKRREASVGADWEWWFVSQTGAYGMRVQAKRISLPKETFGYLRYTPRGHTNDQMTTLIGRARADHLAPAYCFYVASQTHRRDGVWPDVISPPPSQPSGCLVGHAEVIRAARSNRLDRLASALMPWHLLVCPREGRGDLTSRASAAMRSIARGELAIAPSIASAERSEDADPYLPEARAQPPSYVRRLIETGPEDIGDFALDGTLADRAIRGLLVIRDADGKAKT